MSLMEIVIVGCLLVALVVFTLSVAAALVITYVIEEFEHDMREFKAWALARRVAAVAWIRKARAAAAERFKVRERIL